MERMLLTLTAALLLFTGMASAQTPATTQASHKIRIVLVGDSTVTDHAGWGAGFARLAGPEVQVINTAVGGRSSKSFRDEGKWDKSVALKGDYMLIQFGHNVQPGKGPERETDANTTYKENMKRYATEAKAAGFKPIIVTSLVRRKFGADGKIKSDLSTYVDAAKAAAEETHTPIIDLHALSLAKCEELGKEKCEALSPLDKDGKVDTTHLKGEFGDIIAALVVHGLKDAAPELSDSFKPTTQPTK